MGTSLNRTAYTVTVLNFQFAIAHCFVRASITSLFLKNFLIFSKSSVVPQVLIAPSKCCFSVHTKPTNAIFYNLEHKAKSNIQFAEHLSFLNTVSSFPLKACASNIFMAKLETPGVQCSVSESTWKCLNISISVQLWSPIHPINYVCQIHISGVQYTLGVVQFLFVYFQRTKPAKTWWQSYNLWIFLVGLSYAFLAKLNRKKLIEITFFFLKQRHVVCEH